MAENKNGFLLFKDLLPVIKKLVEKDRVNKTNNAGELFLHVFEYVNDTNPVPVNDIVDITFEPIKQTLKRNLKAWEKKSAKTSETGRLGGIKSGEARRSKTNQNEANASNVKQNEHVSVSDSVSVPVSGSVSVKKKKEKKIVLKDVAAPLSDYQICVDFWLKEFHPGWTFTGQHGKALNSILAKLKTIIKDFSPPPEVFKKVCLSLPEWYKNKDLQVIDSKFNELITEIKDKRNGQQSPNTANRGTHPLQQMHDVSSELLKSLANSGNVQGGA